MELKKAKSSNKEVIEQLTGAQCLIAYCREIGKKFWKQRDFLNGYEYRFVSIGHISIAKQKPKIPHNARVHDTPEHMMKIVAPHYLHFNKII